MQILPELDALFIEEGVTFAREDLVNTVPWSMSLGFFDSQHPVQMVAEEWVLDTMMMFGRLSNQIKLFYGNVSCALVMPISGSV